MKQDLLIATGYLYTSRNPLLERKESTTPVTIMVDGTRRERYENKRAWEVLSILIIRSVSRIVNERSGALTDRAPPLVDFQPIIPTKAY